MFVVALVAFMTAFNLRSLKSVANFNTVIVVLQVVLIAVILGMVFMAYLKVKARVRWRALVRSGLAMRMLSR
ncbi:putative amino acid permease [Escherichia coli]|uniref:Putative amino acid permease n=1 Tax=Escherichia coli TaxID=562 RepID=A0A376VIG5_ECOLX|nr:putative amino acid permease [Escherichia coli]